MYSFFVLLIITIIIIIYGIIEFARHKKRIYSIPIRIHVNGTRGKSSVTRLIGAGLRAGGISTITKVTGTFPRLILENGKEVNIYRKEQPNIIEQLSIVKFVASRKVKALVIECMALQPLYQWITENKMIHATAGVITNVRPDHLDVMGPSLLDVADALCKTIPKNQHLFTAENSIPDVLKIKADKQNTVMNLSDCQSISVEEMNRFTYIEHAENVALAVAVCDHYGVKKETALKGMYAANPDEGVLKRYIVEYYKKQITFYNAFAANDPESTFTIWEMLKEKFDLEGSCAILLNTRQDRLDRARQLAEMIANKLANEIDYIFLMGQSTDVVENITIRNKVDRAKIINLGWVTPDLVFEKILSLTDKKITIIGIGNIGGMGAPVAEYFEHRSLINND